MKQTKGNTYFQLKAVSRVTRAFFFILCVSTLPVVEAQTGGTRTWNGTDACDWSGSGVPQFEGVKTSPSTFISRSYSAGPCSSCFFEEHPCVPPPGWTVIGFQPIATLEICPGPDSAFDGQQCDNAGGGDEIFGEKAPPCKCSYQAGSEPGLCFEEQPPAYCKAGKCERKCPSASPTPPPEGDDEGDGDDTSDSNSGGNINNDPTTGGNPDPTGPLTDEEIELCKITATFAAQPANYATRVGHPAVFSAQLRRCPAMYQWEFRSRVNNSFKPIPGGERGTLYIEKVSDGDEGLYRAIATLQITGTRKSFTSSAGQLTIDRTPLPKNPPPVTIPPEKLKPIIIQQPQSIRCEPGSRFSLSIEGTSLGMKPSVAWEFMKKGTVTFSPLAGESTSVLGERECSLQTEGMYRVRLWNDKGSLYSAVANVHVFKESELRITSQPKSVTIRKGATATFLVAAKGGKAPLRYAWQFRSTSDQPFKPITTATTATLSVGPGSKLTIGQYRVVVQDSSLQFATSEVVTCTIPESDLLTIGPPIIVDGPSSRSAPLGGTTPLSVIAGGASPLSFEWLREGTRVATTNNGNLSLVINDATKGTYQVRITNALGSTLSPPFAVSRVDGSPFTIRQGALLLTGPAASKPVSIAVSPGLSAEELSETATITIESFAAVPIGIDAAASSGFNIIIGGSTNLSTLVDLRTRSLSIAPYGFVSIGVESLSSHTSGTLTLRVNGSLFTIPLTAFGISPSPTPAIGGGR